MTNLVRIFPNRANIIGLVGAMPACARHADRLIEQNKEWMTERRCYMSKTSIADLIKARAPNTSNAQTAMARAA